MPGAEDLSRLFGGRLEPAASAAARTPLTGITTDSRLVLPGGAFVAVPGEQADGHAFVADAARRGAALAVVEASWPAAEGSPPLLLRVEDTARALRRAGEARLAELGCAVVGVTGSVGKTTAKELIAHVLGERAARPPGNLNTWTGIPCSVLQMEGRPDVVVLELAMSARGEIADLASFTHPDVGVLLNIGLSHIELLGSQEAIAEAKAELLEALPADGLAVLNADDPWVHRMASRSRAPIRWFGLGDDAEEGFRAHAVRPRGLLGTDFLLTTPRGEWAQVRLAVAGAHLVSTACAAAAVAAWAEVPLEEIAARLGTFRAFDQRGVVLQGARGAVVYDDSYNSAPASLAGALSVLRDSGSERRVAVIGDMLELGDMAAAAHDEAGRQAAGAATVLITVGDQAARMVAAATAAGLPAACAHVARDADEAAELALAECGPETTVLVKASHGLHLERVVERLRAGGAAGAVDAVAGERR